MLNGMGDSGMKEKILAKIMELLAGLDDGDEAKPEGVAVIEADPEEKKEIC